MAAAYGWSADISDDAALRGWLALNSGARGSAERARRILAEDPDLSPEERLSDGWSTKALFMTVWRPSTRSAENSCGIRQG